MNILLHFLAVATMAVAVSVQAANDLGLLSDEFNHGPTITNWQRIHEVEGWGNDVLQGFDINTTRPGCLFMMPYSSTWYGESRGELTFKYVTGDFVVTTEVQTSGRGGAGAPQSDYSLAGIMIRTPRSMTNVVDWVAGGQNYVFLSLGSASSPGSYQFEVKTTVDSVSTLNISDGAPSRAMIQIARLGPHIITLQRSPGGSWQVHQRYFRPDMPTRLQVGLTTYTDWQACSAVGYANQNTHVLTNGARMSDGAIVSGANPDLMAAFEYVRYCRPQIPTHLVDAKFSDPSLVADWQLLAFLGAKANVAFAPPPRLAVAPDEAGGVAQAQGVGIRAEAVAGLSCVLQSTTNLTSWTSVLSFPGAGVATELVESVSPPAPLRFYRVLVNP